MPAIVITGASGFVAANLRVRLGEIGHKDIRLVSHDISEDDLRKSLSKAEIIFHLAGVNRPQNPSEFESGNRGFTARLCAMLAIVAPRASIIYASSTQAGLDNPYGRSKKAAEDILQAHGTASGADISIFRLTNVFGKWSRPNYNSVVATFCHNVARDLPISVSTPEAPLNLIYIDDVVDAFIAQIDPSTRTCGMAEAAPIYSTTVGEVAALIMSFRESRENLITPRVGAGLVRALYSTYVAALPTERFSYTVPMHSDPRGTFVEMLRTPDCGQFSFFTAHPGITRGEHYHHSKTEKFLVVSGVAEFGFRHIETGETHRIVVTSETAEVVETVPGWSHNITNIGNDLMIVMLWANEIFDRERPDTIGAVVGRTWVRNESLGGIKTCEEPQCPK
jgi:UDP-2-acetamido-2,6-beta-L-arabino-hexul-4-ose reductase